MEPIVFLYVTAPDDAAARRIAEALVEGRLAACVNILPRIRSVYRWKGEIERADEAAMIVKTTAARAVAARALIQSLHPYETPTIAALAVDAERSGEKFVGWIASETMETIS